MHRVREFFRFRPPGARALAVLLASSWLAGAHAAPVPSLFAATVPEADPQRAAQQAMREVLVRLMGTREAVDDPALSGLIGDAQQYVQVERSTTRGATQVLFDGAGLRAAVSATGRSIWNPDRPLVWVVLPPLAGPATDDLRAQLTAASQMRGLPIALVSADSPASAQSADVLNADAGTVLAAARRAGAGAALLAQPAAGEASTLQWTLVAPAAEGHWVGGAAAAIDGATEALARAARELDSTPLTDLDCRVAGVLDLPAYTAVLGAVSAAPGVIDVVVRSVEADQLTLHLRAHGSPSALAHAVSNERLRASGVGVAGVLEYRYQSGP
ncbi:MAG: DUF2066 domain-containing protein [Steroidobacteraceae bacterium]|jgi:hypothetical protein